MSHAFLDEIPSDFFSFIYCRDKFIGRTILGVIQFDDYSCVFGGFDCWYKVIIARYKNCNLYVACPAKTN